MSHQTIDDGIDVFCFAEEVGPNEKKYRFGVKSIGFSTDDNRGKLGRLRRDTERFHIFNYEAK